MIKSTYVRGMRGMRAAADAVGLLNSLERSDRRIVRWARSLFGIYDMGDLVRLDLPWWTFRAIDAISAFLAERPRARVFEFGAGASTVWLAKRAAEVWSVEHDVEFAAQVRPVVEPLEKVHFSVVPPVAATGRPGEARSRRAGHEALAFDDYVAAVRAAPGEFDLIVIDGRSRAACLDAARAKLAPGGIILFDNSDRAEYQEAISASGLRIDRLKGLAPALPFPSETSLLRHQEV